jgi:hypothetical protein
VPKAANPTGAPREDKGDAVSCLGAARRPPLLFLGGRGNGITTSFVFSMTLGVVAGATFRRHGLPKPRCKFLKGFINATLSCGFYKPLEFCWIGSARLPLSFCDDFCHLDHSITNGRPRRPPLIAFNLRPVVHPRLSCRAARSQS